MSHQHEFYGNKSINPNSTYESLIGQPTGCQHDHSGDEPGDTSAYWHPTLYVDGVRLPVPKSTFYYTNRSDKEPGTMQPWPANLRVIAGDAKASGPQDTSVVYWGCGHGTSLSKVDFVPQCSSGDTGLTVHVIVPDCWDGVHLDSPDHKSHMAYSDDEVCPPSHPVSLPWLIMRFQWTDATPKPSSVTLSSGAPHTFHADFWNSWHQARLEQLTHFCINSGRDCDYGDIDDLPFPTGTPSTTVPPASTTSTTSQPAASTTTSTSTSTTTMVPPKPSEGNLVSNPGFESGLAGWATNEGTTLGRSTDAHSGAYSASVVRTATAGNALLDDSPDVALPAAGACSVGAWVKGPSGATVKLRLREFRDGRRREISATSLRLTGTWQSIATSLVPRVGGTLDLSIFGRDFALGQALLIDDVREVCD